MTKTIALTSLAALLVFATGCQPSAETEAPASASTETSASTEATEVDETTEAPPAEEPAAAEGSGAAAEGSGARQVLRPQLQLRPVQLRPPARPGLPNGLQAPSNASSPGLNVPSLQPAGSPTP